MQYYYIYKKIFFCLLLIFSIAFFSVQRVNAEDFSSSNHNIVVNLSEDGTTDISISINLTNKSKIDLINGYEYILPGQNVKDIKVSLNDKKVDVKATNIEETNFKNLNLNFGNNFVKPGETKALKINAKIYDKLKFKDNSKFYQIKFSSDPTDSVKFSYSNELGQPIITAANEYTIENSELKTTLNLKSPKSLFLIWGEDYSLDINSQFTIKNSSNNSADSIFSIIPSREGQEVEYGTFNNISYGLVDKLNNHFAVSTLKPKTESEVAFNAKVKKTSVELEVNENINYNFGFEGKGKVSEEILNKVGNIESDMDKYREISNYLSSYDLDIQESLPENSLNDYWQFLNNKENLESFDYSFVFCNFAEYLGNKCEIRYGYVVLPDELSNRSIPHFWPVIKSEDKTFLIDIYMQKLTGLEYFGLDSDFDRITFGTWHPDQKYNNALGLLTQARSVQTISFNKIGDLEILEPNVEFETVPPAKKIFSGFYHSLELKIKNKTNKFIPINKLIYDGTDFSDSLELKDDLFLALIPNQENDVLIKKLRTNNFLREGVDEIKLELGLENEDFENIEDTFKIQYKVADYVIIAGVIIFNVLIILGIYTFWKYYLSKRII